MELNKNTIVIVPSRLKNKLIKKLSEENKFHQKIFTLEEVKKKYYFDYDDQAIYYLMKKYHYAYDVSKMYLSYLDCVGEEDFGSEKIRRIIDMRDELRDAGLLIYSPYFREYLKGKDLLFYNCGNMEKRFILELEKSYKVSFYEDPLKEYKHDCIYEFDTIEDEVVFVADSICSLVLEGIPLSKIKLCGVDGEYPPLVKRIFQWFHIPICFQDGSLYATVIGQDFLKHLDGDAERCLDYISKHYNLKDHKILDIYHQFISILNRYVWAPSLLEVKDFIIHDLKNIKVGEESLLEEVEVTSIENVLEDDIVFLLGFNQGVIPRTYKDEDYFNDSLKEKLGLESTSSLNQEEYQRWLRGIQGIANVTITEKRMSPLGEYYLSSLNDELKLEIKRINHTYKHSHLYNQLMLGEKLDVMVKYHEESEDLDILYQTYPDISYRTYDSRYRGIEIDKFQDYLGHKLVLSYSAMNTYYQCGFRYYLANVLKLNVFEETFYTVVGNLFHYILSICFEKEIDLHTVYWDYVSKCEYLFNARELFFLSILEEDLKHVIETIRKQNEMNSLSKIYTEKRIVVEKDRAGFEVDFKGFVDKMYVDEKESMVAIVDYKTGNPDLNLNHTIYGLDLQLPVYIYLAKKEFSDARIVGFYLQKILNTKIIKDYKHSASALKEEKLKLQGYSNSDLTLLECFDSSYVESKVIKGMRMNSKGIASKKVLDDVAISKLRDLTEEKIDSAIDHILQADFSINPKRIGGENLGCQYCCFRDICFRSEKDMVDLKEYKNMEFLMEDDCDDTCEAC